MLLAVSCGARQKWGTAPPARSYGPDRLDHPDWLSGGDAGSGLWLARRNRGEDDYFVAVAVSAAGLRVHRCGQPFPSIRRSTWRASSAPRPRGQLGVVGFGLAHVAMAVVFAALAPKWRAHGCGLHRTALWGPAAAWLEVSKLFLALPVNCIGIGTPSWPCAKWWRLRHCLQATGRCRRRIRTCYF